jgi:hypothetical protein
MRINRTRAQGPKEFKHDVGMSALNAGAQTFDIHEKNMTAPVPDVPLNTPNAKAVTEPADGIRRRNRLEESGSGGIKTTAGGMAKEMIGKDNHQPISPTSDLFRNDAFYNEGSLVEPQQSLDGGTVLPSGLVIRGDTDAAAIEDKDFFKGSVFEKK